LAGLGVPAGFGQSKATATNAGKKKSAASGSSSKSQHANTSPAKKAVTKVPAKAPAKTPTKTSARTPDKGTSSKTSGKKTVKSSSRSRKQAGQKAPSSDRINEIQAALARDGSYQGAPSGKWDENTAAAMRKFQAAHGLSPNGKLDAPSLQRLGLGSQTAGVAAPTPPPGATSRLTSSNNIPSATDASRQQ
jgi:peptidoglycan hydrolase-like protein with peptidoglycan-binding domain